MQKTLWGAIYFESFNQSVMFSRKETSGVYLGRAAIYLASECIVHIAVLQDCAAASIDRSIPYIKNSSSMKPYSNLLHDCSKKIL